MKTRTNAEWLQSLNSAGEEQALALADLRVFLLRAAHYSLDRTRGDLAHLNRAEIAQIAEDAAQDALVAILKHLADFRSESKFTTWAYKFAINFALVAARREQWRHVSLDELLDQDLTGEVVQNDEHATSPSVAALRNEIWENVQEIMTRDLTERQRQALQAIVLEDVPLDEVARHWGSSRNATYKLLHDARRKLKAKMEDRGFTWQEVADLFSRTG